MTSSSESKKALIQHRLDRAQETLLAAHTLYKQKVDPASVVNRAYYSMFYAALALLASIGKATSKHSGVLALFDQYFIKTKVLPKEMSKFLHIAFDARQTGDYEEEVETTEEQAAQILDLADQFVKSIEEKLNNPS